PALSVQPAAAQNIPPSERTASVFMPSTSSTTRADIPDMQLRDIKRCSPARRGYLRGPGCTSKGPVAARPGALAGSNRLPPPVRPISHSWQRWRRSRDLAAITAGHPTQSTVHSMLQGDRISGGVGLLTSQKSQCHHLCESHGSPRSYLRLLP